jgi:uncharacterized protein YecE (DUF72 family)
MVHIGTSGYSYDDWVGPFYPEGTAKPRFFAFYLQHFRCVELNFTHYALPSARTMQRLVDQTPDDFRFTLKSFQEMTIGRSQDLALYRAYREGIQPVLDRGQLGCILLQFPNSFRLARENVNHVGFIREQWPDLPLVVEFRHREWVGDERTFDFLRKHGLGFCCVDEPRLSGLVPPVAQYTADPAYVRFHGRNAAKWYQHEAAWERYDYLYSREELGEWLEPVRSLAAQAADTYLFFNNHYQASAVKGAQQFAELLEA